MDDYSLNLACFHECSRNQVIVPVVVSNSVTARRVPYTQFDSLIKLCRFCSMSELGSVLASIHQEFNQNSTQIDAATWDEARFRPIPPIIDAAVALYSDMNVFEIGHACAAQEDLDRTTETLVQQVLHAKNNSHKVICFVTGVPGAGKTLVGLNSVHQPEIRNSASFLSGNGPLVKVIQEALVRDSVTRQNNGTRKTRRQATLEVKAFIHNVHRFADEYYGEAKSTPAQNVVVFDEAQRAWDAEQNRRFKRPAVSEAKMMLEVMDRHSDWAVIIALVGGGQEINRGEAGLAEWGRALSGFPHWVVCASPEVLRGGSSVAGFRLFEIPDTHPSRIKQADTLHLDVCIRSIRAQRISDWVNAVLLGEQGPAADIATGLQERPVITRSLSEAREWLKQRQRGKVRCGLVSSASAARLRADGLEISFGFHREFDWEHWFLDEDNCTDRKAGIDVRCSSKLEVAATQFEIQGLELDWIGVCWGEDLVWSGEAWRSNHFNNKRWRENHNPVKHAYRLNGYRVLLTRARHGMVIYVPNPASEDSSRLNDALNRTAEFLVACGAQLIAHETQPAFAT